MMKKLTHALVAAGLLSIGAVSLAQAADAAPASPHTFTGNVTLASEYLYRGIAQTRGEPAIQGGFDYAHASGFYAGVWGSNISWIQDANAAAHGASLELDVYGGYKGTITGDWGFDVGVLTYNYPGTTAHATTAADPDTVELYGAVSWKWLTLKHSRTTGSLFGWTKTGDPNGKTSGSGYTELNATYDLGGGWGLTGHLGHQSVKDRSSASYSDYKIGATKDLGFGTVGFAISGTNAKDSCTVGEDYCFVNAASGDLYEGGKTRGLLTFGKTF